MITHQIARYSWLPLALGLAATAAAQDADVTRRTWTFLGDRLLVNVVGGVPGQLQVVRGQAGRIEVAARSQDGFPGFGLGGTITPELRLTAVGADHVSYLVVVPENVRVAIRLPDGALSSVPARSPASVWDWSSGDDAGDAGRPQAFSAPPAINPTLPNGLHLIHSGRRAPAFVDLPDLGAVRTVSLRHQGSEFRIAVSRHLSIASEDGGGIVLRPAGPPVDIVIYVPRGTATFHLRSGDRRLADITSGRARPHCGNVMVQAPTPHQNWLTFHPQAGELDCR